MLNKTNYCSHGSYVWSVFPSVNDLVVVKVTAIDEVSAHVSLLEYGNIEGMILLSELSRRRMRSVYNFIRIGSEEVVSVLKIDTDKKFIDLSKKQVISEDVEICREKYNKSKKVQNMLRRLSHEFELSMPDLCELYSWPLYREYGHAYDAFRLSLQKPEIITDLEVSPEVKSSLKEQIDKSMSAEMLKIRADVEVMCFGPDGIDAIKSALTVALSVGNITAKLVSSPVYALVTLTTDYDTGIALVKQAIKLCEEEIRKYPGGDFKVKMEPKADATEIRIESESEEEEEDEDSSSEEDELFS